MKISSIGAYKISAPKVAFQKRKAMSEPRKSENYVSNHKNQKHKETFKKVLPYTLFALSTIAGVGVGFLITSKKLNKQQQVIQGLKTQVQNSLGKLQEGMKNPENKSWLALLALAGISGFEVGKMSDEDANQIIDKISKGETPLQSSAYGAMDQVGKLNNLQSNPTSTKYGKDFYGLSLLHESNVLNRNTAKYNKALENIRNIGFEKLTSKEPLPPLDKAPEDTTIWSVTSEFAPIKEGGLGSVPVEVRNNVSKLGINIPTFVPMYLHEGVSTFSREDEELIYNYKGKKFPVEKLASFKMDVFKDGKPKTIPVEFYVHDDRNNNGAPRKLVLIKCDEYFDGTIYEANSKTEEPEKFAVMSKAVYEFAKLKMDGPHALKDVEINSSNLFREIQAPDAFMLNDWQASPIAALARYKAGMENAYGKLSDETAKKLQEMRIVTLGHNVMHQGKTDDNNNESQRKASTSRILNTLFDKYTFDIVQNAKLNTPKIDPYDEGLKNLDNVLVMNEQNPWQNHTNFLNMGIVLSDYFHPVSKHYADELISPEHSDLSNALQWALMQKSKAGKLVGVINGNDYSNISLRSKKEQIKKYTGVDFETTSKFSPTKDVLEHRFNNKKKFYNEFILPFAESSSKTEEEINNVREIAPKLEFVKGAQGTELPVLSDNELKETPFLISGGRLVSQKGIDILCDSIKKLFDNWEKDFPNRPKPIIFIAGPDGENGAQRQKIEKLKGELLSKEDNNRVLFAHGFAFLSAFMAGSDFFMMPSKFEPCGLTQGESMAVATPVIASAVGGIVDTVNRDGKHNGILTSIDKPLDANEFYEATKKGLNIFYNNKQEYNRMVQDSLLENFSWIQKGKQGPIFEYLNILGIDNSKLPEVAEI